MQRTQRWCLPTIVGSLLFVLPWCGYAQDGTKTYDLNLVTQERLLKGTADPSAWLMYGGNYESWRFSPLKDINRQNVRKIRVAWMFQTGLPGQLEASPIVADGVLYLSTSYNHVYALDAATGDPVWKYDHPLPDDLRACCGPVNRGVAIADDRVFMATLDARLVALDRKTGKVVWTAVLDKYADGYSSTGAPLVVKDKVIVGMAGADYGVRGYVDAYDVKTGERKWRTFTIPGEGEKGVETWAGDSWKHGGGPTWSTGSYDPEQDVLFWAVGNTAPNWNGDMRKGDNLYTDSVLAVNPDTGAIQWHFQFTPHDVWDYDGNTQLFLVKVQRGGKSVKALAQTNRNGFLYVLDRTSGKFLHGAQYVEKLNWAKGLDENGRPIVDPQFVPQFEAKEWMCPGVAGGQNSAYTAAYSPTTQLMYVPVIESCMQMKKAEATFVQGLPSWGGGWDKSQGDDRTSYGHLSAIDPATGLVKWRQKDEYPLLGGTLATAGGLVFTGNQEGYVKAYDDTNGKVLWQFQTGASVRGQPATYKIGGRQYIAVPSGGGGIVATAVGEPPLSSKGSALIVFALP